MHNVLEAESQQLLHGDTVPIVFLEFLQHWNQIALEQTGEEVLLFLQLVRF
jgi:hypothetical protein